MLEMEKDMNTAYLNGTKTPCTAPYLHPFPSLCGTTD